MYLHNFSTFSHYLLIKKSETSEAMLLAQRKLKLSKLYAKVSFLYSKDLSIS